jgi:hypothetical protein
MRFPLSDYMLQWHVHIKRSDEIRNKELSINKQSSLIMACSDGDIVTTQPGFITKTQPVFIKPLLGE